jgi:hypothetical protein
MAAKQVLISADDTTYYLLPGGTGELTREGRAIKDTIFGQTYESEITGPISWGLNANAIYKGYPGYIAKLLKPGTSTAMAAEACTLVSGQTYRISAATKRIINRAIAVTVFDNAVDHTADVESIDYLFGKITFKAAYTIIGPVTITGEYFPMLTLAKFQSFTLTQTAVAINNSDMPNLQTNGGFETFEPGLKTVNMDLPSVFAAADGWHGALVSRAEYVIETNPDGTGITGSVARGFFRLMTDTQSGDVGALEQESLKFSLSVPISVSPQPAVSIPFGWEHGASSPIPTAIQTALTGWQTDTSVYGKYLHNGVAGWKGAGVLTNLTLNAGMDSPNIFTVAFAMSGAPVAV